MVAPPKPTRIKLAEAVDRYLDGASARVSVGSLSDRTLVNYASDLRGFVSALGAQIVVDDITGEDVDRAIALFGKGSDGRYADPTEKEGPGRSVSTQGRFRQSINRFFEHAERQAWVQVSPMPWSSLQPRPRGGLRTARTSLTPGQAEALLRHGAGPGGAKGRSHEMNYERDRLLLAMLTVLGPRVSEAVAANDEDFTWVEETDDGGRQEMWRIVGKGGKVRTIPLSKWLSDLKADYQSVRPTPSSSLSPAASASAGRALLRSGRGSRMAARDVQRLLAKAYLRVVEQEPRMARKATPHALRHTAATLMLASGWDVKLVAQMLGHASIATTGIYLDELPGELALALAQHPLSGVMDGQRSRS